MSGSLNFCAKCRALIIKGHTAKLFAKHMKLPDQIKRLKKGDIVLGVGTPHRIAQLIQSGALKPGAIVMDFNFRNSKKQRLIDEKESFKF